MKQTGPRVGSAGKRKGPKADAGSKLIKSEFPANIHITRQGQAQAGVKRAGEASRSKGVKLDGLFNSKNFETLPKFKDVPQNQRSELFRAKLRLCRQTFNFKDAKEDVELKDLKRNTLLELVDYLNANEEMYSKQNLSELMKTVSSNIFRALGRGSPLQKTPTMDPDEDEPNLEEAWPHYQLVYELLLKFIMTHEIDAADIRTALDEVFITKLLELFDSEDPRERDYLKTILHRIYGRFMPLREFVRDSIMNFFLKISYEYEENNGISELLEILCSIISGFQTPLKDTHTFFLMKGLLPLHKVGNLSTFHQHLQNCIVQFIEKDNGLTAPIIAYLLKVWPITNAAKEVLYLTEIEEFFDLAAKADLSSIYEPFFKRLSYSCIVSNHFQVAERSLFLLNNEHVIKMLSADKKTLFPIVMNGLMKNKTHHWNQTVQTLSETCVKSITEIDRALFDEIQRKSENEKPAADDKEEKNKKFWEQLEKTV